MGGAEPPSRRPSRNHQALAGQGSAAQHAALCRAHETGRLAGPRPHIHRLGMRRFGEGLRPPGPETQKGPHTWLLGGVVPSQYAWDCIVPLRPPYVGDAVAGRVQSIQSLQGRQLRGLAPSLNSAPAPSRTQLSPWRCFTGTATPSWRHRSRQSRCGTEQSPHR